MDNDQDILIYDVGSSDWTMDSNVIVDLSCMNDSITIDISSHAAAQSVYTVGNLDSLTTGGDSSWSGVTDWLVEREIIDQHHEEKRIRESHPAVQSAWEQYQIMLNLAREEPEDPQDSQF